MTVASIIVQQIIFCKNLEMHWLNGNITMWWIIMSRGCMVKVRKILTVKLLVSVEIVNIFLPINLNMFWCSKEVSHWDSSFECPQNMLLLRNKKINFSYTLLSRGPWLYAELLVPKNEPALEILVLITLTSRLTRQNTKYGCRWSLRPKFRHLVLLDMWAWIFKDLKEAFEYVR